MNPPLLVAVALAGLLAGVYAAFAIAVMPGLRRVDDAAFVAAMTAMNRAIVNPAFLALFLGAPAAATALAVAAPSPGAVAAAAASALSLGLTFAANIPLNRRLDARGERGLFERRWTAWHLVRTACAAASFILLLTM